MVNDKMVNAMKKNYIIPNTTSVAFQAGYICQAASPAGSGMTIGGNSDLEIGGNVDTIDPL